jgi:hypothetical protein
MSAAHQTPMCASPPRNMPRGIRLNSVVPGQLHRPMVEALLAKQRTGGDVKAA